VVQITKKSIFLTITKWFFVLILLMNYSFVFAQTDSLTATSDTLALDTMRFVNEDIEHIINYTASDSVRFDVLRRIVHLYGKAKIVYGDMTLNAAYISIDQNNNLVTAMGQKDSLGKLTETPVFQDKGDTYKSDVIKYNFKTKKGLIAGTSTRQGEGFINSEKVKRSEDGIMYAEHNVYTTCDLPHPHFGIRSRKMKVIPNKLTASGAFLLEIEGIPTPLGFPFGMFPQVGKRTSGFVMPQFGETRENGFFLANGGFYWVINDNIDLSILGEVYSKGRYGLNIKSNYLKKYKYQGNLNFVYNLRNDEIPGSLETNPANDFRLNWSHSPQTKKSGRFMASVSAGTSTFNQRNALRVQDYLSATMNSNVSYSKTFVGTPFTFGANLRHFQNIISNIVTVSPSVTFNMNSIFPFAGKDQNKKTLLSQLSVSYSMQGQGELTNQFFGSGAFAFKTTNVQASAGDTVGFNFSNAKSILSNARFGMQHSVPIGTAITVFKYFQVGLNGSYRETWYPKQLRFVEETNGIRVDTLNTFSRFYAYNIGTSVSTRYFMTYYPKFFGIEAFRHTLNPTVGLNYTPDFGQKQFGFFQTFKDPTTGKEYTESRFDGMFGRPQTGESGSISLSLANIFELKLRPKSDSTTAKAKKVQLFNLNMSTSYNMVAKEYALTPVSFSLNSTLGKGFTLAMNGSLDPYAYLEVEKDGKLTRQKVSRYAWQENQGIGGFSNVGFALNASLNPDANKPKTSKKGTEEELRFINQNPDLYIDFNLPWNLNVSYNANWNRNINTFEYDMTQNLVLSGSVKVTPKWNINFNSGYDFRIKELTYTSFNIARDLHCWTMNVQWIPFGQQAGYYFTLGVKAAILQDLKLEKRNFWYFR